MADRPTIDVATRAGGWGAPWPNVAEIESVLSHDTWTLVGGLMAQLHAIHAGMDALRPTNDVDIVLHVETTRGIASETARALELLGYELAPSIDERNCPWQDAWTAMPTRIADPSHPRVLTSEPEKRMSRDHVGHPGCRGRAISHRLTRSTRQDSAQKGDGHPIGWIEASRSPNTGRCATGALSCSGRARP